MKARHLFLTALFFLAGCSVIWTPTATVKKFMTAAQKGDVETMTQLFSSRAIRRDGIEKIRESNQVFAKMSQTANSRVHYQIANIKESKNGNNARVAFDYQMTDQTYSIRLVFALSTEGGAWKIDNVGGPELEEIEDLASSELKDSQVKRPEPIETPPSLDSASPELPPPPPLPNQHAPISGGALNEKAISLPKPAYPPVARAAKASGTVVVQVVVDEGGNVISAHAISGHPLLQAAAVVAARSAKFPPTKLSGQPVKVNGTIEYTFTAE
jgi:TonB family protein